MVMNWAWRGAERRPACGSCDPGDISRMALATDLLTFGLVVVLVSATALAAT